MHPLLFILITFPLGIISWIDLGTLLGIVALIVYIYRFGRSRVTKEDMDTALKEKASTSDLKKDLKLRDQRIDFVEKLLTDQSKFLNDKIDEQFAIVTQIHDILSKKK